jgi:hypothetical protein
MEEEDKNDPNIIRLIFKKKVKVALNKGESTFREVVEILRSMNHLSLLEFDIKNVSRYLEMKKN